MLSVGIDPNWKHIVPPGQRRVVSEAHCVSDCTQQALPPRGINVFAVNQHTHLLGMMLVSSRLSPSRPVSCPRTIRLTVRRLRMPTGRQVQLRHVRGDRELPALVDDANYDVNYQEYRQFHKPVNVLPVSISLASSAFLVRLAQQCTGPTRLLDAFSIGAARSIARNPFDLAPV